jgi:sulfhydrogenase subunit alpha
MSSRRRIDINVPVLTRVEGEGALDLHVRDGRITQLQLRIFEPPRFFEKMIEGYRYDDVIEMVARICGICPVAYQMSAVQAFERLFGVDPGPWVKAMRRVMYCGEWLQSHSLHIHLLAAPDYFGVESVLEMASEHPEVLQRGLMLQALGNDLIRLFGARSVHPVGVMVGGFRRAPAEAEVESICRRIESALAGMDTFLAWCASLPVPAGEQEFTSVALREEGRYAIESGRIAASNGLDLPVDRFEERFREFQQPYSTALHAALDGGSYLVGPLARLNLNGEQLPPAVRRSLEATGIKLPSGNMFHSLLARAVEIHLVLHEALELLKGYARPDRPSVGFTPRAGETFGATEAPRGMLWHGYRLDDRGRVQKARIVPPTSQNQGRIEEDLRLGLEQFGLDRADRELRRQAEMIIRNYDPCISCATHLVDLKVH